MVLIIEIRCVGLIISINNIRYFVLYIIKVIGDFKIFKNFFEMWGGIIDFLKEFFIEVKIEEVLKVMILCYNGSLKFNYVKIKSEGSWWKDDSFCNCFFGWNIDRVFYFNKYIVRLFILCGGWFFCSIWFYIWCFKVKFKGWF